MYFMSVVALTATPYVRRILTWGSEPINYTEITMLVNSTSASDLYPACKRVIVLADISGSMSPVFDNLKTALKCIGQLSSDNNIQFDLVTFCESVHHVYPTETATPLNTVIDNLVPHNNTNISDALTVAYRLARNTPEKQCWVLLLTDGEANEGITATSEILTYAKRECPANVHMHTLGLGHRYSPVLLGALGEFERLVSGPQIQEVLTGIMQDIVGTFAYGTILAGTTPLAGEVHIGCLMVGRRYTWLVPEGADVGLIYHTFDDLENVLGVTAIGVPDLVQENCLAPDRHRRLAYAHYLAQGLRPLRMWMGDPQVHSLIRRFDEDDAFLRQASTSATRRQYSIAHTEADLLSDVVNHNSRLGGDSDPRSPY